MGGHAYTLKLNPAQLNVTSGLFIHLLYFIYARKFNACKHVKITRQRKSTLKELYEMKSFIFHCGSLGIQIKMWLLQEKVSLPSNW